MMITTKAMVEVFKTDVAVPEEAQLLADALLARFPNSKPSFDLDDCDKVLRIEGGMLCTNTIINIVNQFGYNCHILDY
ncbi:hypothetical protein [Polluticoccus soli]|uniref:hypothetical protein n=1 Tax=Polluticoccus soli TaxID=3034150 RepID=UPI0023E16104|nr:hypothetical protein [Flavipsychrobacter sp. JY13-12]